MKKKMVTLNNFIKSLTDEERLSELNNLQNYIIKIKTEATDYLVGCYFNIPCI